MYWLKRLCFAHDTSNSPQQNIHRYKGKLKFYNHINYNFWTDFNINGIIIRLISISNQNHFRCVSQFGRAVFWLLFIIALFPFNGNDHCWANGSIGNNVLFASLAQLEILWHTEIDVVALMEKIIRNGNTKYHYLET